MSADGKKRSAKQVRLSADTVDKALRFFQIEAVLIVPDDLSQRRAFRQLMPYIQPLRKKGCTWLQITKLLSDCGIKLEPATVRSYFNEMIAELVLECNDEMKKQFGLMREIASVADQNRLNEIRAKAGATNQAKNKGTDRNNHNFDTNKKPGVAQQISNNRVAPTVKAVGNKEGDSEPKVPQLTGDGKRVQDKVLRCEQLQENMPRQRKTENLPDEMFSPGPLEHPAISGLLLTLDERLYGVQLKLICQNGVRDETPEEKQCRLLWRKPVETTIGRSDQSFVKFDTAIF